jgi:hypothetical protein
MFKKMVWGACGLLVLGLGVNNASALTLNGVGEVTDWGLTPFTNTAPAGVTATYGNNYSPINYPNGIGHQPSPGGTTGEKFDLEGLYARRDGNQVQVLLVSSSLFQATANGYTFNLGDLMIDVGNDGSFDLGVVTQTSNANNGLVAGGLYDITTTRGLQEKPGSYYQNSSVVNQIGAWAVQSGTLLGQHDILTQSFSYLGEANTWLYEFAFDLTDDLLYEDLRMQFAWGCGNDVISLVLEGLDIPTITVFELPPAPEPASALLGAMGLGGLLLASRRRRA